MQTPPTLSLAISLLLSLVTCGTVVAEEAGGFKPIFDGKTLSGLKAPNMSYWSVQDDSIAAESTEANPCTSNQYLVWQGGEVADFELKAKFRLAKNQGNSGIQFRSEINAEGMGVGYQADILPGGPWCGALADEYTGREPLMAQRPQDRDRHRRSPRLCITGQTGQFEEIVRVERLPRLSHRSPYHPESQRPGFGRTD